MRQVVGAKIGKRLVGRLAFFDVIVETVHLEITTAGSPVSEAGLDFINPAEKNQTSVSVRLQPQNRSIF